MASLLPGDAGQYPGLHDRPLARPFIHRPRKPKIFQAVGNKRRSPGSNPWPPVSAARPGRRWSAMVLPAAGRLASFSFWSALSSLIGLGKLFRYALNCFCWLVRSSSLFCHSRGKREQTHSIQPPGFTSCLHWWLLTLVSVSRSGRRGRLGIPTRMYRLDTPA